MSVGNITFTETPTPVAGAVWKVVLDLTWTGATVTEMTAVLADKTDPAFQITEITSEVTMTNTAGTLWKAIFPAAEMQKFLATEADANSKLVYKTAYLFCKVTGDDADGDSLTPTLISDEITICRNPLIN